MYVKIIKRRSNKTNMHAIGYIAPLDRPLNKMKQKEEHTHKTHNNESRLNRSNNINPQPNPRLGRRWRRPGSPTP